MKREDAITHADKAAATALNTTASRVAGFAATYDVAPSVFAQFLAQNPDLGVVDFYGFAARVAEKRKCPAWDKAGASVRTAFAIFWGSWKALERLVAIAEAEAAEAARAKAVQGAAAQFGKGTFDDLEPGIGDKVKF